MAPEARAAFPGTNGLIALGRSAGGNSDIWVMGSNGSNETRLATNKHGWVTVATETTKPNGTFVVDVKASPGTYRALAKRIQIGSHICGKATSDQVEI